MRESSVGETARGLLSWWPWSPWFYNERAGYVCANCGCFAFVLFLMLGCFAAVGKIEKKAWK
jgi:hypothetical protein